MSELALLVKRRRQEMGLSQARLAELAGLSRVTINQLENGKIFNLSLVNAETLANQLGYGIGLTGARSPKAGAGTAVDTAARTASVSYGESIPVEVLRTSLITGTVPPNYIPQLRTFDEAPVGVLSAAASEIEGESRIPARTTWQRMRSLAAAVGCKRSIWT